MKCENCGKSEINFHYSSNVNGSVTETHLCADCAAKSGYEFGRLFDMNSLLNGFFPIISNGAAQTTPISTTVTKITIGPTRKTQVHNGLPAQQECAPGESCNAPVRENAPATVDAEMLKRRELNIMREQMRLAAEKDDFEKAAELRDQIREMEAGAE